MSSKKWGNWVREPLVQFLIIAAVVFALDRYVFIAAADDPNRVVIDDKRLLELIEIFREGQGRDPSSQEVNNMIVKWSQNEIFYREALKLEMDQGDEMIRNRMVLKMRNVLLNRVMVEAPTDKELQEFLDFQPDRYDTPELFDVELVQFRANEQFSTPEQALAALDENTITPTDLPFQVIRYRQRSQVSLLPMFGDAALGQLTAQVDNQWLLVSLQQGPHFARITQRYPKKAAELPDVRSRLTRDWKKFRNDIQLADQTQALADAYKVELNLSAEAEQWLTGPKVNETDQNVTAGRLTSNSGASEE